MVSLRSPVSPRGSTRQAPADEHAAMATRPALEGRQASDPLGPGALILLGTVIAGLLVVPVVLTVLLLTGSAAGADEWMVGSVVCLLALILIVAGMWTSRRDTRQLRTAGVPGRAAVISVEPLDDGLAVILRVSVEGMEPFTARARASDTDNTRVGHVAAVSVDPAGKLFRIID